MGRSRVSHSDAHRKWRALEGPLHAETLEPRSSVTSAPLILLHGFTQTRRSWDPFLDALDLIGRFDHPVIRVDLPGHGGSRDVVADLPTTADLVVETCGPGIYCGYSMGGRVALHVALRHPHSVERLITIGATPGIADDEERRRRKVSDDDLADTVESIGVDAFLERWLAQPMFAALPRDESDLDERRTNSAAGLASSLRHAGTGTQVALWSRLSELSMPVLLLAGQRDLKFSETAEQMAGAIGPNARSHQVDEAGHSAHLENPTRVAELIADFCS